DTFEITVKVGSEFWLGGPACVVPAVRARHLAVGQVFLEGHVSLVGTAQTQPGRSEITVTLPQTWRVRQVGRRGPLPSARRDEHRVTTIVRDDPEPQTHWTLSHAKHVRRGGPFFAFGGNLGDNLGDNQGDDQGDDSRRRLRLRAGYEHAVPHYLIHALAMETDFANIMVVPSTEVASGIPIQGLIVPSFALGVGAPLQVFPRARLGFRAQATASWWPVSFVTTFDVFPTRRGPLTRWGLMGQVSF
ncbi:MAG: hypothetical protein AAF721_24180, partial [Myxococcota bacterium]